MFGIKKDKQTDKQVLDILLRENSKLKAENVRLLKSQEETANLKKEYQELIAQVKSMRDEYKTKLNDFSKIETEYREKLEAIVK